MKPELTVKKLENSLESLVKMYRVLLKLVRREKDLLIRADLESLQKHNVEKESFLLKLNLAEQVRLSCSRELAVFLNLNPEEARLKDFFSALPAQQTERLQQLKRVLEQLMSRVKTMNHYNEVLVQSALGAVQGSLTNLKENLGGAKTYKKTGAIAASPAGAGQLVRKEA